MTAFSRQRELIVSELTRTPPTTARFLCVLALALLPSVMGAQQSEYEKWLAAEQKKYETFLTEDDKQFSDFLAKAWTPVTLTSVADTAHRPTPTLQPRFVPTGRPTTTPRVLSLPAGEPPAPILPPPAPRVTPGGSATNVRPAGAPTGAPAVRPLPAESESPAADAPAPGPSVQPAGSPAGGSAAAAGLLQLRFFGSDVSVRRTVLGIEPLAPPFTSAKIAAFWKEIASAPVAPLLAEAQARRGELQLGDWGYTKLLAGIGGRLFGDDSTRIRLFTWFMLVKSGYDVKVGYGDNDVHLLLPSSQTIYYVSRFSLGTQGREYYALPLAGWTNPNVKRIYTYKVSYPGATRALDFRVARVPAFAAADADRVLRFKWRDTTHQVRARTNRNYMNFLRDYPHHGVGGPFATPFSEEARATMLAELRRLVAGRDELDAVGLLLRFTQTAFEYQTNEQQFGRQKPVTPDETIFYPYSDCKGRSVFFAALVRELLGLEVIGLDYPDHIATAVRFTSEVRGDVVEYRGRRFIMADPTYIGASVGMTMPNYVNVKPGVFELPRFATGGGS